MSSLAQQLRKVGTTDATRGKESASRHRASFLFDSKQAADYDLDTIFSIGTNGITELKQLDEKFAAFEKTLFSESMKGIDRILQSKEDNAKLDESIASFLQQMSPYFLLKPSGKALEWLIRRFRIHEFNIDAIIHSILPYHETGSFVTLVSLLQIEEGSRWSFLRPIRKSKQPLDRSILIQNMMKDRSVVEVVCEIAAKAIKRRSSFKTLMSFYAAVMLQYISAVPAITDETLTIVFPYVLEGLQAKAAPEFQIASYMIISQIAERATLTFEVLESLFATMTSQYSNAFQMLLCLVHICQTQETFEEFPEKAFKNLARAADIDIVILTILKKYNAQRFLLPFLIGLVKHSSGHENYARLLTSILSQYQTPTVTVRILIGSMVDQYLIECSSGEPATVSDSTRSILSIFHHKYSTDLDIVLQEKMDSFKDDHTKNNQHLYTLIATVFSGTRHQPLKETNTTLFLSVNHGEASIRLIALKKLEEILNDSTSGLAKETEDSFVVDTLEARLQDDDERIVQQVLGMTALTRFVPAQKLLDVLVSVVTAESSTRGTRRHCLVYLLTTFLSANKDLKESVMSVVFGHLLLVKDFHKASAALLTKIPTSGLKGEKLLAGVFDAAKEYIKDEKLVGNPENLVKADLALVRQLAGNLTAGSNLNQGLTIYINGLEGDNVAFRILAMLVLTKAVNVLDAASQVKVVSQLLPGLLQRLTAMSSVNATPATISQDKGLPSTELLKEVVNSPWAASTELAVAHFALLNIIVDLKPPATGNSAWLSAEPKSDYSQIIATVYKALVGQVNVHPVESILLALIGGHLTSDSIEFLASVWTDANVSAMIRLRSIQIASPNLKGLTKSATVDFQVVIPTLLISLSSPVKAMRVTAVEALRTISTVYPKAAKPSGKKSKGITMDVFKFDTFYGTASDKLEFLLHDQASSFLLDLLHSAEEFVTDGDYLGKYLTENLNPNSSDTKTTAAAKDSLLSFLLSHVVAFDNVSARVHLLELLNNIHSATKLKMLLPLVDTLVHSKFVSNSASDDNVELARYLVRCFSPATTSLLEGKSVKYKNAFLQLLKLETATSSDSFEDEESDSSFRRLALGQISEAFFAGLGLSLQREIFSILMDLATNAHQETIRIVKKVLKEIPIRGDLVISELDNVKESVDAGAGAQKGDIAKRQRKVADVSGFNPLADSLHRLVALLELLVYRDVTEAYKLVVPLFEMLAVILNEGLANTPVSIEYINQLLLSNLTNFIGDSANASNIDEGMLRVDLIVQCIRVTGNPQTHNQALLLMAGIASLYPEKVLNNIMSVFTFMGANVLRQDDNYSFHVIQQTLEKIIPPLVVARRRQGGEGQDLVSQVRPIIKVFVDALPHIPQHRRLRLFSVLISTLGEDEFLHAVISLILEKSTSTETESWSEFALALSNQFSAVTQMRAIISLMQLLQVVPNEKVEGSTDVTMGDDFLFDMNAHKNKNKNMQIRQFKLAVLNYSAKVLTAKSFLSKILIRTNTDSSAESVLEGYYLSLAENILLLVSNFSSFLGVVANRKDSPPGVIKFWRGIVKVVYDVLDKVHILLSLPSFIKIMVSLFEHKDATIRRKALGLFNRKISNVPGSSTAAVPAMYEDMVVAVSADLAKAIELDSIPGFSEEEVAINKQTALLSLSTIVRQFGKSHPAEISKLVPVVIGKGGLLNANEQVQASCLVCLTFMCQELGPRFVPNLPKFMPTVLSILADTLTKAVVPRSALSASKGKDKKLLHQYANNAVLLQLAVVSHLETLIRVLPQFVSPYVSKILAGTLHPALAGYDGHDPAKIQILEKNRSVLAEMARHIPPRVLLPPILAYYDTAVKDGKNSLLALFDLVSQTMNNMARDVIAVHYKQIFKFFLTAFDFRRVYSRSLASAADQDVIEESVIKAFMQLVMKLNETLFKPMFLKTLDWATTELSTTGVGATESDKKDRLIFFYRLLNSLLESLKSIVTPYYGYVVDHVIETLTSYAGSKDNNSKSTKKQQQALYSDDEDFDDLEDDVQSNKKSSAGNATEIDELWPWMISSLQKCFLYDNDGLWNAERFEKLLHPLVNQMLITGTVNAEEEEEDSSDSDSDEESSSDSEEEDKKKVVTKTATSAAGTSTTRALSWSTYVDRLENYLVPCLGQFAVTLSNDALWKSLNYQVMLKTREEDVAICMGGLKVLSEFYKRLGEEFLILLPETIPFIAETLENMDPKVQALTQQVVAEIEAYLGGSLQKYFH